MSYSSYIALFYPDKGPRYVQETGKIIDSLDISGDDHQKIWEGTAGRLLKMKFPFAGPEDLAPFHMKGAERR